ncbi:MAG: hypothetical protein HKN79_07110 [Flavobacteriales bacterium]|nr:hypothetical protein [Flavobacteriales bacterium]
MSYRRKSRIIRPFLFTGLGLFFILQAPILNADMSSSYRIFGSLLVAYAVFRAAGILQMDRHAMIVLVLCSGLNGCQEETRAPQETVLICHPSLVDLIHQEYAVFNHLYPHAGALTIRSSTSLSDLAEESTSALAAVVGINLEPDRIDRLEETFALSVDSMVFIRDHRTDTRNNAPIRIYEFEPYTGPVSRFIAFLTSPRGQLIAAKAGYLPAYPPEREWQIREEYW